MYGLKNFVHQVHKQCQCIRQTKQNHQELKVTVAGLENGLGNVLLLNLQLMIVRP